MKPKSSPPDRNDPTPEIPPPPGDLPKHFPEKTPLSDDGLEAAKHDSPNTMKSKPASSGSGEDPFVESGLPENDPERPRETPEESGNR